MTENKNGSYVCVHCGSSVKTLYKKYSTSVLKLCNCEYCGNVADKYLEYDKIIILIDLILLSKEAYRHVLFNIKYKNFVKLAFLLLIMISFDELLNGKNSIQLQESDVFYDTRIYIVCFATVLGKILFLMVILLLINAYTYYNTKRNLVQNSIIEIWRAVVCSSFGYFFLLTILIWDDFQREIHLIFIHMYTLLSQIQALTVTTSVPRPLLGVICTFANAVDQLFSITLRSSLGV